MGYKHYQQMISRWQGFLVNKAKASKFSTVNNYLSAVITLHKYYGFRADFRQKYFIKMVIGGLKKRLGSPVDQKEVLTVEELLKMYGFVDM